MDANKLKKLHELGYRIRPCCGMCRHGCFTDSSMWGTCDKNTYDHLKHTESKRQLSIHMFGCCEDGFERGATECFGGFEEFTGA